MAETVDLGDGRRATYEVMGRGEPLLTFVGGPGFPASFIRPDADLLAERFMCFLIDPHGSGGSTPPNDHAAYDHLGHARFYDDVRRALKLDRVTVHGVSFGGTVALTYAALFPHVVSRCIAVSAFALGLDVDAAEGSAAAEEMERALQRHAQAPWYPEARAVWDGWTEATLAANDPAEVDGMLKTALPLYCAYPDRPEIRERLEGVKPHIRSNLAAVKAWEGGLYQTIDLRGLLPTIRAATLLIAGEADVICGPAQARPIADALSDAELVTLRDCGHFPALEQPLEYQRLIFEWSGRG
jgi:pimeloyl-ACP methyl ester carboxylesterase